jgi:WD40 repeat protein
VAFIPSGTLLASADGDNTVRLWNPATGRLVATIQTHTGPLGGAPAVAFSPNGTLLATGESDGTVRVWNPAADRLVGAPLQTGSGPDGGVIGVAFSRSGKLLASVSLDGTVRLWNMATQGQNAGQKTDLVPYLCALAGRPLTRAEWARYVPQGLAYQRVCP